MKVKICGLTNNEDAQLALDLGAWALGFVMVEESPRYTNPEEVARLISQLEGEVKKVAVLATVGLDELKKIIDLTHVGAVQLHGDETLEYFREAQKRFPRTEFIKALRPQKISDVDAFKDYSDSMLLIDTYKKGTLGGTGILAHAEFGLRAKKWGKLILSGGLTPANVFEQVTIVNPWAVDVSSGVEERVGKKSPSKMKKFFNQVGRVG